VQHFTYNKDMDMAKRGASVSIRVHPTIKFVIDYLSNKNRIETGAGLSNDEALWRLIEQGAPDAVKYVKSIGAAIPTDGRKEKKKSKTDTQ
jgi:hypothetical protein